MTDDASGARACRILLVEDDGPVRERLAGIIRGWAGGRLVASCATLGEATSIIASQPLDLLITDLNLPNGHGVDAIRMLRAGQPDAEAMVISVLAASAPPNWRSSPFGSGRDRSGLSHIINGFRPRARRWNFTFASSRAKFGDYLGDRRERQWRHV